jgi:hypothetical protein
MTSDSGATCTPSAPGRSSEAAPMAPEEALDVVVDEGIVVLTVRGHLDARVGEALGAATEGALRQQARRLDIDLRQVASFTGEGVAALRGCRARAARLREGLHYRTGRGPGRDALLAAYPRASIDA